MPQIGDTIRYLNAVGGGRIVRIEGPMAFVVDDDGFETPVLLRECVVVGNTTSSQAAAVTAPTPTPKTPAPKPGPAFHETPEGEKITALLAFEPVDLKRLSSTTFHAILVNDSNYNLQFIFATKAKSDNEWTLRASGSLEPMMQLSMTEISHDDLPEMDCVAIQFIASKAERPFSLKKPLNAELRIDTTKFARLHCFRPNVYFDNPVLTFNLLTADETERPLTVDPDALQQAMAEKKTPSQRPPAQTRARDKKLGPLVVDLHIDNLIDSTAGMSNADMLERQLDEFHRVMKEHARDLGARIVFIHGKGEGVLRRALLEQLRRHYPRCQWQDASFREYGFGATQVTIHR